MMELNTGASLFIISETTYSSLSHALSTYTGEKITLKGTVNFKVQYQTQNVTSNGGCNRSKSHGTYHIARKFRGKKLSWFSWFGTTQN